MYVVMNKITSFLKMNQMTALPFQANINHAVCMLKHGHKYTQHSFFCILRLINIYNYEWEYYRRDEWREYYFSKLFLCGNKQKWTLSQHATCDYFCSFKFNDVESLFQFQLPVSFFGSA